MTTLKSFFCALVAGMPLTIHAQTEDLPQARVTARVIDENGQSIEGAHVGLGFWVGPDTVGKSGISNRDGTHSGQSATIGSITYGAGKPGYYDTINCEYDFNEPPQNGRWQPWNPTLTVVLKKIINPVPMYAKQVEINIPAENSPVGFDLQEADWIAPWGKGHAADFVFQLKRRVASPEDYECHLRLSFTNKGDGIQSVLAPELYGSILRLPHNAPADGYQQVWERTDSSSHPAEADNDQNYFFRVRTKVSDDKVYKSLYGKIHGDIRVAGYGAPRPIIIFIYYLNPDGTTNVEFDPKRNLFKNLKPLEEVRQP